MFKVAWGNLHSGLSPKNVDHYLNKPLSPVDGQHFPWEVGVGPLTQSDQIARRPGHCPCLRRLLLCGWTLSEINALLATQIN
jgi:hypothetical protein